MSSSSLVDPGTGSEIGSTDPVPPTFGPTLRVIVALSIWCGLVAGLLEVGAILLRKHLFDADRAIRLSHHFLWLVPIANLCIFLALAVVGFAVASIWPHRGRWLFSRALATGTLLPPVLALFPKIYGAASLLVAAGIAVRVVPIIERNCWRLQPFFPVGFAVPPAIVAILAGSLWYGDHSRQVAENARHLPPPGSPNVLMLVLDTVAAGHASVNGYDRATTNTLSELATRGIRFDCARSTSSWTLPSHASMFTGRWYHELSLGWLTPFDRQVPTIAEFLGNHGFATAGFVANTWYCGRSSGLSRGFTHYEDYIFPHLTALKSCGMVSRALENYEVVIYFTRDILKYIGCFDTVESIHELLNGNRKDAAEVNRELLDWLSTRDQPDRPFFAFLNYFDAHYRYVLKPGRLRRFGAEPDDEYSRILIDHWGTMDKTGVSPSGVAFASNAYDDCIADLDEQVGKLIDALDRRGTLEHTWLIVVSDHGESFGEHPNTFCHGASLFDTEVRVPLLIIPPSQTKTGTGLAVREPVSLRDVAATIADMAGLTTDSSFPGDSLARFWKNPSAASGGAPHPNLSELVPNDPKSRNYWGLPTPLSPRASLKDSEWSYLRREVEGGEQLYHLTEDVREQRNLAQDPSVQDTLLRLRASLDQWTRGPLLPSRFPP
jgi:arylsulfatase A-like enzyme